jgi:hypothetical protein
MSIELVPLCTVRIQLKPPLELGAGPAGTRLIFEVMSAKAEGDRLNAELMGAASADWALIGPDGTGMLDIRLTLRADDGALILAQYNGRADVTAGLTFPITIYVAPRFETADERYGWLNRVQAVGKGVVQDDLSLDFEWYEVR